jgi:hypothetical protein
VHGGGVYLYGAGELVMCISIGLISLHQFISAGHGTSLGQD